MGKGVVSIVVLAATVIFLALLLFPFDKKKEPGATIRIAFNTWIGYSSFYIAEKEGLFDKYGIKVKTTVIDPLAEKNAAMVRGDLDGMGGTIDSAVISASSGVNATIIYMFDRSNGTDGILVTDAIRSVKDLKGRSIAVEEGFVGHFFLLYVLDKEGIGPDAISIIPMTTDQAGTAFLSGKVDAAVTWEPRLSAALKREGARVLISSADVEPILADTLFVSRDFLKQRSEDARALVRALNEANELWNADPGKYVTMIAERWGWPKQEIIETLKTVEIYDRKNQERLFSKHDKDSLRGFISKAEELWFRSGVLSRRLDVTRLVDETYVKPLYEK